MYCIRWHSWYFSIKTFNLFCISLYSSNVWIFVTLVYDVLSWFHRSFDYLRYQLIYAKCLMNWFRNIDCQSDFAIVVSKASLVKMPIWLILAHSNNDHCCRVFDNLLFRSDSIQSCRTLFYWTNLSFAQSFFVLWMCHDFIRVYKINSNTEKWLCGVWTLIKLSGFHYVQQS